MASSHSQPNPTFAQVVQLMTGQMEPEEAETTPEPETTRPSESELPLPPKPSAPVPPAQPSLSSLTTQDMPQMPTPPLVDIGEFGNLAFTQLGSSAGSTFAAAGPDDKKKDDDDDKKCQTDEEFQKEAENNPEVKRVIEQIIAKIPKDACGVRPPQHRKEIVKVDSKCPPRTATIRRRLPSPEPDTVERVTVIKSVQDIINIIIEKPSMPPPCCVERTEREPPLRPLIRHNVVCVPPSGKCPPGTKAYEPLSQSKFQKESAGFQPFAQFGQPEVAAFTTPQAYQATSRSQLEQGEIEIPITIETPTTSATRSGIDRGPAKYTTEPLSRVERIYYSWPETIEAESPQMFTTSYVRRNTTY